MAWVIIIIGFIELIEGLIILIWPDKVKNYFRLWVEWPNRKFILPSLISLIVGLILIAIGIRLIG